MDIKIKDNIAFSILQKKTQNGMIERGDIYDYDERLEEELDVIRRMGFAETFLLAENVVNAVKKICYPLIGGVWSASLISYALGITQVNPLSTNTPYQRLFHEQKKKIPKLYIIVPEGYREKIRQVVGDEGDFLVEISEDKSFAFMTCKQAAENTDVFADSKVLTSAAVRYYKAHQDEFIVPSCELHNLTQFAEFLLLDKTRAHQGFDLDMLCYERVSAKLMRDYGLSAMQADNIIKAFAMHSNEREEIKARLIRLCNRRGQSRMKLHEFLCALTCSGGYTLLFSSYKELAQYLYTMEKVCFIKE